MAKKQPKDINIVQEFLKDLFGDPAQFNPGKHFYKNTGIKQKRWGQIFRNEKSATIEELSRIAGYFGQHISVITDKRQLNIFKDA